MRHVLIVAAVATSRMSAASVATWGAYVMKLPLNVVITLLWLINSTIKNALQIGEDAVQISRKIHSIYSSILN